MVSGESPLSSIVVTGSMSLMHFSTLSIIVSSAVGSSWIMNPPAFLIVRSGLTSTPKAQTVGICSLVAK